MTHIYEHVRTYTHPQTTSCMTVFNAYPIHREYLVVRQTLQISTVCISRAQLGCDYAYLSVAWKSSMGIYCGTTTHHTTQCTHIFHSPKCKLHRKILGCEPHASYIVKSLAVSHPNASYTAKRILVLATSPQVNVCCVYLADTYVLHIVAI